MKTKLSTAIVAALFFQLGISGATETNSIHRSCCAMNLSAKKFTDQSLYQVESVWTTDAQKQIKLGALAGKPQVVLMFYSRCTTACPILENELRQIEAALPPETRAKTGFTLISFDSERDTPAALAEYRKVWNLPENWTLLSGQPDDVLELAALLGIQFKKSSDGEIAHSNVITLLNAQGEIVFRQTGLNAGADEMVRRIEQIVE
ncbi:MAG TPA: SCO family protein [Verrucomicrobiae bacterium]|nr:SCO family protein [Verrucomicrobiae bacterium]